MEEKKEIALIGHYFQLVLRKRWFVIVPFCLAMAIGFGWAIKAPKIYQAKTLILVEPQTVPKELVRPVVASDMGSRIATINQQITSRSNLEKIIDQFQLFSDPQHQKLYMEDKLERMRKRIVLNVARTNTGGDAFSVMFTDSDPERTMKVANTLSTYFIEANLQIREDQAESTSNFIEGELETMRARQEQVEAELREFRKLHMGELPEQMEANLKIMDALQKQLEERKDRLRDEKNKLVILEREIDQAKLEMEKERQLRASVMGEQSGKAGQSAPPIQRLYEELATLQSTYTDLHPDVIRLRKKIEDMEKGQRQKAKPVETGSEPQISDEVSPYYKPLQEKLKQSMAGQLEISKLQQDMARIERQIREYQQRIEKTPKVEGELMELRRDYDNIRATYSSLLNRKLESNIAVNMEKKKKGDQFRILDHAKLPEKPVSPDLKKIFMISLVVGLGIGFAFIFLLDFLDPSIQRKEDLSELGVPVLVTIPRIYNERSKLWMKVNTFASLCSFLAAGAMAAGFAFVAFSDRFP